MASYYLFELALGAFILLLLLYKYMTSEYSYWKEKNVPYIEPTFPYGNIKDQVTNKTDIGRCFKALYDQMPEERYFGIFELGKPALVLKDLDIIKAVMVTNFDHFVDRGHIHEKVKKDYLAARHLFNLKNEDWRKMRTKLLPTFTSGRMKMMFHYMHQCSERLDNYLSKMVKDDNLVEFKDLLSCFTSDVISTCLFGLETNAIENKDSEVRKISRLVFPTDIATMMKLMLSINQPYIYDLLGLEVNHKKVKQFCMQVAKETYTYRTTNNVYRDDFIDLLIQIKQNKNLYDEKSSNKESRKATENDDGLTFEEMAAQVFVMLAAGFETSSTTLTMALYEMCKQPDILAKAVREIDQVLLRYDGQITYQSLKEMTFLEKVIYETLRLYPSLPILTRKCTKQYTMPGSDLTIEKGTRVIIPAFAIGRDPKHFPDPMKYDPERFNPTRDGQNIPSLSFGDGPMMCIGLRFGKMQVKCGLVTILSKFTLSAVPETPKQITLNPSQFLPTPMEMIYLKVSKREEQ